MTQFTKERFLETAKGRTEWRWIEPKTVVVVPYNWQTRSDVGGPCYLSAGAYRVQGKDYTAASLEKTGDSQYRPVESALSVQHYREAEQWEIRKFTR